MIFLLGVTVKMCYSFLIHQRAVRRIRQCHKTFIAADLKCKQKPDILKELDVLVEILLFTTR